MANADYSVAHIFWHPVGGAQPHTRRRPAPNARVSHHVSAAVRRGGKSRLLMALLALLLVLPTPARARDPFVVVLKNTLLGGVTGLVLGGTATLVADEEDRMDIVRWGVVIGTFVGFGFGIWRATKGSEDLFAAQPLGLSPDGAAGATSEGPVLSNLVAARATEMDRSVPPEPLDPGPGWAVRIPVLRVSW